MIVDAAQGAVAEFVLEDDWTIVEANGPCAAFLGFDGPAGVRGRSLVDFCGDRILLDRLRAALRAEGRATGCELEITDARGRSGGAVVVLTDDPTAAGRMRGFLAAATEAGYLRRSLLGAQRMEAIGRLAGGIAHDFNGLLTVIGGHAERLAEQTAEDAPLRKSVVAIERATRRASSLTRQLLAFGRRQVLNNTVVGLHRLVREIEPALSGALGPGVGLRLELPSTMPDVSLDGAQFEDALLRLMANARDAMPNGGTVTVGVDELTVDGASPAPRPWIRAGAYARLVVADTGHGMDPVVQAHAFEPFFTTRSLGQGAGLGLATVYGFVKQSGGYVFVESEPGHGATFTLLFPLLTGASRADSPSLARQAAFETIFVVAHDDTERAAIVGALVARGHTVLDAPPGDRAVDVLSAFPSRVHLLLVDESGLTESGRALVSRLRAVDPLVQVLHVLSADLSASTPQASRPHLARPFTLDELTARVRHALDTGEGRSWSVS